MPGIIPGIFRMKDEDETMPAMSTNNEEEILRRDLMKQYPDLPERASPEEWEKLGISLRNLSGEIYPEILEQEEEGLIWINDALEAEALREADLEYQEECREAEAFWKKREERNLPPLSDEEAMEMFADISELLENGAEAVPKEATIEEWEKLGLNLHDENGEIFPEVMKNLRDGKLFVDLALKVSADRHHIKG